MESRLFPSAAAAAASVLVQVLLAASLSTSAGFLQPFDLLYDSAVHAFYGGDYGAVVRYMEAALGSYTEVRSTRVRCRLRCQDKHQFPDGFSELPFFDAVLRRAACTNACIEEKLGPQSVHKVSDDVLQDFHRRIPYNYLQLAYQKVSVCVGLLSVLPTAEAPLLLLLLLGNGMRPRCLHANHGGVFESTCVVCYILDFIESYLVLKCLSILFCTFPFCTM